MSPATQETPAHKNVTDYLSSLVWDGVPRIDRWLVDCAGAEDTPHVRAAGRMILVAAVRRARTPGCRFDQLPVIEGPQGSCKSSALRMLAVDAAWFTHFVPLTDSDARKIIEATSGKWIVEASELESLLRAAGKPPPAAALKSFLARTHDEARLAYQREVSRVPRSFVVVGTTGQTDFLMDPTGNRRIVPVHIRHFDLDRLREVRDQLWAEAAVVEAAGQPIQPPDVAAS